MQFTKAFLALALIVSPISAAPAAVAEDSLVSAPTDLCHLQTQDQFFS